jgi:hypothetical protein
MFQVQVLILLSFFSSFKIFVLDNSVYDQFFLPNFGLQARKYDFWKILIKTDLNSCKSRYQSNFAKGLLIITCTKLFWMLWVRYPLKKFLTQDGKIHSSVTAAHHEHFMRQKLVLMRLFSPHKCNKCNVIVSTRHRFFTDKNYVGSIITNVSMFSTGYNFILILTYMYLLHRSICGHLSFLLVACKDNSLSFTPESSVVSIIKRCLLGIHV